MATKIPSAAGGGGRRARRARRIPDSILNDPEIAAAASVLPDNYSFEIHKTIWKLREAEPPAKKVALQLPEGLLMFATVIGDIIERFTGAKFVVLGDVTYGACCVDDLTAKTIGCDFLVHYGHSCLVPVGITNGDNNKPDDKIGSTNTTIPIRTLYIFVEIAIDVQHIIGCIQVNFGAHKEIPLTIMGTIQFTTALHEVAAALTKPSGNGNNNNDDDGSNKNGCFHDVIVPQGKPLSPGETLGCTSPKLINNENNEPRQGILIFIADGRFHLEAAMIHNPQLKAYRYDPYGKTLTSEKYDINKMKSSRQYHISKSIHAKRWGIVLGTLGRQGNPAIFGHLRRLLKQKGCKTILVLLSEVFPAKLSLFKDVDVWVQVACPRLSIDWGDAFEKPLLTPYEALVALKETEWRDVYPMDYYSDGSGPWTNQYHKNRNFNSLPKHEPPQPSVPAIQTTAATTTTTAAAAAAAMI